MSGGRRLLRCLGVVGVFGVLSAIAFAATGPWGTAIEVPGTAALNTGGSAGMGALSCVSPGICSATGSVSGAAFAANETNGVWGPAVKLTIGRDAGLYTLSCPTAGSCAAGGQYTSLSYDGKAFLVDERHGVWGKPIKVPGMKRLNHGDAWVSEVSCAKPGFCEAGGGYGDGRSSCGNDGSSYCYQAFLVSERKGVWHKAIEVPGTARLNRGGDASIESISCWSAGNCIAAGSYNSDGWTDHAFVVREKRGVWGKVVKVRVPASLSEFGTGGSSIAAISCANARSCAAVGVVDFIAGSSRVFVLNEKKGQWGKAAAVPGMDGLENGDTDAWISSLSCARAGWCMAGGTYVDTNSHPVPFLVTEKNGVWGDALNVPGLAALNVNDFAQLSSVSCATASSCAAGGYYVDGASRQQAWVVSETDGVWSDAIEVPGTADLNVGDSGGALQSLAVFCATATACVAGGPYTDAAGHTQAFVTAP